MRAEEMLPDRSRHPSGGRSEAMWQRETTSFSDLSTTLWRERRLLELLALKLEVEHLLRDNGRHRWLGHLAREIEAVIAELDQLSVVRAQDIDRAALDLGIVAPPTLRRIAGAAPPPWGAILDEHRSALARADEEVAAAAARLPGLLARRAAARHDPAGLRVAHGDGHTEAGPGVRRLLRLVED